MTVREVSNVTGVSVRTLHYYDEVGLLKPRRTGTAGYRVYEEEDLSRLQMILLYRALQFPVKEIKRILDSPDFERNRALEQQIELLTLQRDHIDTLITFARGIHILGVKYMDFSAFDTRKMDDYAAQAKAAWGKTEAWKEFEEKKKHWTAEEDKQAEQKILALFQEMGRIRDQAPDGPQAQSLVLSLRQFYTDHFYTCTPEILRNLGRMYAGGGAFTENIDACGGPGTAVFAQQAIEAYCHSLAKA
ncbi:MAG: MerR family transcriptional regulator [Clostridia bacterium]|nr:MerR family transcriptional regulator [Clostridia bacterium]